MNKETIAFQTFIARFLILDIGKELVVVLIIVVVETDVGAAVVVVVVVISHTLISSNFFTLKDGYS